MFVSRVPRTVVLLLMTFLSKFGGLIFRMCSCVITMIRRCGKFKTYGNSQRLLAHSSVLFRLVRNSINCRLQRLFNANDVIRRYEMSADLNTISLPSKLTIQFYRIKSAATARKPINRHFRHKQTHALTLTLYIVTYNAFNFHSSSSTFK